MKYHYTPTAMVKIINKNTDSNMYWQICEAIGTYKHWW